MTDTTTALVAYAVDGYYGDPQVIVAHPDGDDGSASTVAESDLLPVGYDADRVLADLGYARVGEWRTVTFGAVCDVEEATR